MSNSIIIAPTYRYLSNPIISKLEAELRDKYRISIVDFYETRRIFCLSGKIESACQIHRFQMQGSVWSLKRQYHLKKELFEFLEVNNPRWIITFSDVTVFSRLIKKSKFSSRLILIQPCLLDFMKYTFLQVAKLKVANLLNAVLPLPVFKEERSWGYSNKQGYQLIWSHLEAQEMQGSGQNYICGDYFVSSNYTTNISIRCDKKILVILPDLNFYTQSLRNEYEKTFLEIVKKLKDHKFLIKYHPLNKHKFDFEKKLNISELQTVDLEQLSNFSAIISCVSNLAIELRKHHEKICIFDLMSFNVRGQKYFDKNFFHFSTNVTEITEFLTSDKPILSTCSDFRDSYFKTEKSFVNFWKFLTSGDNLLSDPDCT